MAGVSLCLGWPKVSTGQILREWVSVDGEEKAGDADLDNSRMKGVRKGVRGMTKATGLVDT